MISIVTAYYNRKKLFYRTLMSIDKSAYRDFEVIAVDDASSPHERIKDLAGIFPFLKVIEINKKDKWYFNSCIPFNLGIAESSGDVIVLQNPECLHVHDVLSYITKNINNSNYISISAYSINKELTENFPLDITDKEWYIMKIIIAENKSTNETIEFSFEQWENLEKTGHSKYWRIIDTSAIVGGGKEKPIDYFKSLPQKKFSDGIGWYNHSKYNPVHYHFCSAITKKNMDLLGGFDERFAMGIGYEDNELVDRVNKLGLNKIIIDDVSVIHQWHEKVFDLINPEHLELYKKNANLYDMTRKEGVFKANDHGH